MAVEGMPFPWRWDGGTIFLNLGDIWGMSVNKSLMSHSGVNRDAFDRDVADGASRTGPP